jgi:integrase
VGLDRYQPCPQRTGPSYAGGGDPSTNTKTTRAHLRTGGVLRPELRDLHHPGRYDRRAPKRAARPALVRHRLQRRERNLCTGVVFGAKGLVEKDTTTRAFRLLLAKAGLHSVRLHDLRHYVATQLLVAGVDVRTVAGRLGHRNASITLNVYSHFLKDADRQAAEVLAKLLDQDAQEPPQAGEDA